MSPIEAQGGPLLAVVGWSGSGKTTLLTGLIARLSGQGHRVNVLKYSHHAPSAETPHKDTARLRAAGARQVVLVTPSSAVAPLPALLAQLPPASITLIEGGKRARLPKLEVWRPSLGQPALYPDDPNVLAVAADVPAPPRLRPGLAWLALDDGDAVHAWVATFFSSKA